jgi:transposase
MSDRFDHTLERKLDSKAGEPGDAGIVRRIELITGGGRRRRWSTDDKARIIVESLEPGATVSEVARRHGLSPQQLFGWRRGARALMVEDCGGANAPASERAVKSARRKRARSNSPGVVRLATPAFAPVVIAASPPPPPTDTTTPAHIEIAFGDYVVRVVDQVETSLLTAVLRAVRRAL